MRYNKCLNRASSVLIVQSYHATHLITTHGWCLWWCKNVSNLFGYNGMPFLRRKIWNMFTCELSSSVLSQMRGRFDRTTMADWRNNRWRMASVTIVRSFDGPQLMYWNNNEYNCQQTSWRLRVIGITQQIIHQHTICLSRYLSSKSISCAWLVDIFKEPTYTDCLDRSVECWNIL